MHGIRSGAADVWRSISATAACATGKPPLCSQRRMVAGLAWCNGSGAGLVAVGRGPAKRCKASGKPVFDHRHDAAADIVSIQAQVGVAGVVDPTQPEVLRVAVDGSAPNAQQRSHQTGRAELAFGGHAAGFAAGKQLPQTCFHLIVRMVRQGKQVADTQQFLPNRVARAAGRVLAIALPRHGHTPRFKGDVEFRRHLRAVARPACRARMQSMIDVDGDSPPNGAQRMQQHRRVPTAAERDPERTGGVSIEPRCQRLCRPNGAGDAHRVVMRHSELRRLARRTPRAVHSAVRRSSRPAKRC